VSSSLGSVGSLHDGSSRAFVTLDCYAATDVNFVRVADSHNGLRRAERAKPTTNEALPQTVEHVGIYADLSVGLRRGLVSLYVVLPPPLAGRRLDGEKLTHSSKFRAVKAPGERLVELVEYIDDDW
jgi:hypothetical protein